MVPDTIPGKLLVIGSGAIGIEFASFYNEMGSDVTVVEMVDRILPAEDEEISGLAEKAFKKQGLKILTKTGVKDLKPGKASVKATITPEGGKASVEEFDRVILAVGIVGNVEGLGLEELGVKVDRTHITVCLLYTSPSPRDGLLSRMPSSA